MLFVCIISPVIGDKSVHAREGGSEAGREGSREGLGDRLVSVGWIGGEGAGEGGSEQS